MKYLARQCLPVLLEQFLGEAARQPDLDPCLRNRIPKLLGVVDRQGVETVLRGAGRDIV